MATISPFDSKDRVGEQKWYQKITVGYSLQGTNKLNSIPESEFLKQYAYQRNCKMAFSIRSRSDLIKTFLNIFNSAQMLTTPSMVFSDHQRTALRGAVYLAGIPW